MEIIGKLEQVLDLVSGTSTNGEWKKREFIISTMDQYPKKVFLSTWGDRVSILDNLRNGEEVKVYFDASSREYNGRWYTDLRAWRIDKSTGTQPANPQPQSNTSSGVTDYNGNNNTYDPMNDGNNNPAFDDLPF